MEACEENVEVPEGRRGLGGGLTPHKVLGPGFVERGIPSGPLATRMGTGLS